MDNLKLYDSSELTLYDLEHESDPFYKALVHKELLFIRKNKAKIAQYASVIYKQKKDETPSVGYLSSTVNFSLLEQKHDDFIAQKENNQCS